MKKNIVFLATLFIIFCLGTISVSATEITDKLYMDIQIEKEGSLFIREIAVLNGDYSGRLRTIEYKGIGNQNFTGKETDFGSSAIYNGTNITDLKIYDISDKSAVGFHSIGNKDKEYREVSNAGKGDNGVYTKSVLDNGLSLKVFNPSSNESAFYMEYRIKNAVVVHSDVAEIYWNLLGNTYVEDVRDFEVRVSLPTSDPDYRVWLHGPLYGTVARLNDSSATVKYSNLEANKAVTIRMMFDPNLVPQSTKKTGILGKDNILKYEQKKADEANQEREALYASMLVTAKTQLDNAEHHLELSYYTSAMDLLLKLKVSEERTVLLNRANIVREKIEAELVKKVEASILLVKQDKTKESLLNLENSISVLLEGKVKEDYKVIAADLTKMVEGHYQTMLFVAVGLLIFCTGGLVLLNIIARKQYLKKVATNFYMEYYREFPAEYEPGVLEYLMTKNVTDVAFSATILELVRKKIIKLEMDPSNSKKYMFVNQIIAEDNSTLTEAESTVMDLLFVIVSKGNPEVSLDQIKNYGSSQEKAQTFIKEYHKFLESVKGVAYKENFFDKTPPLCKLSTILALIFGVLLSIYAANFEHYILMTISIVTTLIGVIYPNSKLYRTKYGHDHYTKWLAHKKFLLDFGRFKDKDVPDIALWERYLVTATILGCADKVQKSMQIYLETMEDTDVLPSAMDLYRFHLIHHIINTNLTSAVSTAINSSVSYSNSTIASANSPTSSGGGFGGGASGGGGFGGGGGGGGRF